MKCKMCGKKIEGYNEFKINYRFEHGSKYDNDLLNVDCLCSVCIDRLADFIALNSKIKPITETSKTS